MDTTFKSKFVSWGAILPSSFSPIKVESVRQYEKNRKFKLSKAYLSSMFKRVVGSDYSMPLKVGSPHLDDDFLNQCDASECSRTNENIDAENC